MLLELRVENYAVIEALVAGFAPGLNLLTGETGAGKSILIDALALLMGEKASSEIVRLGAERAVISAVFEVEGKQVDPILEDNGLDGDGADVILRREIGANGKGRVFVNNQPATVAVLKQLAPALATIHAQNENILVFDAGAKLKLLDRFAGNDVGPVAEAFARWKEIGRRIAELESDEQDRLRLLDLWKFQSQEIAGARLQAGEDEQLLAERRVLANAEKLRGAALSAYDVLYESNASASALVRAAGKQVEELARFEARFQPLLKALDEARITVEDAATELRDYGEGINASPERLAEVEDRLEIIERLKRKYGRTLDEVLAYSAEVERKLAEMENKDEILAGLRRELAEAAAGYLEHARTLSSTRFEAAKRLERRVETEINDLAMKARFRVEVAGTDEEANWSVNGFDQVSYMVSANPGEPLGAVEKIASGGELSRVMLALKATVEEAAAGKRKTPERQRTLVFDEIDSGIGGRAAEAVGRKLKALGRSSQVLCVTHLPQIASFADHHYLIEKQEAGGRSRTGIRRLTGPERTDEVARMLSGAKLTEASRKNAEQMLKANA